MHATEPRGPAWSSVQSFCERVFSRIEPPRHSSSGTVAIAGVMSALDCDISMDNRFENLSLLAPEKLSKAIADPTDMISASVVRHTFVAMRGPLRLPRRVSHRARLTSCRTQVLPSGSLKSANEL
jgi:hypothetical protein